MAHFFTSESKSLMRLDFPWDWQEEAVATAALGSNFGGFSTPPEFRYRLLPIDPDLLKRRLFAIPLEELAGTYHRFYDSCRVLPRGDEEATLIKERLPGATPEDMTEIHLQAARFCPTVDWPDQETRFPGA